MKKKTKEKTLNFIVATVMFVISVFAVIGVLTIIGWLMSKEKPDHDYLVPDYSAKYVFTPPNLTIIRICSSECVYKMMMEKEEYERVKNDSFILFNQINNSNCGRCEDE